MPYKLGMVKNRMRQPISVNIERGLLDRIDGQRGDVPRSRMVERALEKMYGISEQPQKKEIGSVQ